MLRYEHKEKPLLPARKFYQRILKNFVISCVVIFISLGIGIAGYMYFAELSFTDALLNASMILGGMGPVDVLHNDSAKYFASFYSLFSGITFLSTVALLLAPAIHRGMHRFHLETEEEEERDEQNDLPARKRKKS
jgi:hypothetical protein